MLKHSVYLTGLCLLILPLAACDSQPERLPVSGQVLIDGKPLSYGHILFVPPQGRPSRADLNENGRFELSSFSAGDGTARGMNRIAVFAGQQISQTETRWHAPKKYADYNTSGLQEELTGPTDSLVINLTWAGGKPFTDVDRGADESAKTGKM
jgi:hypothetical protein